MAFNVEAARTYQQQREERELQQRDSRHPGHNVALPIHYFADRVHESGELLYKRDDATTEG